MLPQLMIFRLPTWDSNKLETGEIEEGQIKFKWSNGAMGGLDNKWRNYSSIKFPLLDHLHSVGTKKKDTLLLSIGIMYMSILM